MVQFEAGKLPDSPRYQTRNEPYHSAIVDQEEQPTPQLQRIQESIHVDQREQYKKPSSDPRNQVQPIESVSPAMTYEVQPESRRIQESMLVVQKEQYQTPSFDPRTETQAFTRDVQAETHRTFKPMPEEQIQQ